LFYQILVAFFIVPNHVFREAKNVEVTRISPTQTSINDGVRSSCDQKGADFVSTLETGKFWCQQFFSLNIRLYFVLPKRRPNPLWRNVFACVAFVEKSRVFAPNPRILRPTRKYEK